MTTAPTNIHQAISDFESHAKASIESASTVGELRLAYWAHLGATSPSGRQSTFLALGNDVDDLPGREFDETFALLKAAYLRVSQVYNLKLMRMTLCRKQPARVPAAVTCEGPYSIDTAAGGDPVCLLTCSRDDSVDAITAPRRPQKSSGGGVFVAVALGLLIWAAVIGLFFI
jgi:hypothetical protein